MERAAMSAHDKGDGPYRSSALDPLGRTHEKYLNDPIFHHIVTALEASIHRLDLTPGEVREAAVYACMRVEMRRACNYLVPLDYELAAHFLKEPR
jgi:hypothetical protein